MPTSTTKPARFRRTPSSNLPRVEAQFITDFDNSQALRNDIQDALESLRVLDCIDVPKGIHDDWASLVAAFSDAGHSVQLTAVAGVTVASGTPSVYPLPGYGWDGGNSIATKTINLKVLVSSDVLLGPYAELVVRLDPNALGVAIHVCDADNQIVVHVF